MLDMPKDDPKKEETVKELRKEINSWVASYRREGKVAGRPSFRCVCVCLNARAAAEAAAELELRRPRRWKRGGGDSLTGCKGGGGCEQVPGPCVCVQRDPPPLLSRAPLRRSVTNCILNALAGHYYSVS